MNYTYGDANHKHAVTSLSNGNSYGYDANGNMTSRTVSGQSYTLGYDAENRMTSISGALSASFVYNGDGMRVKSTVAGVTTAFIGNYYEWRGSAATSMKYYYAGSQRIAMRTGSDAPKYLLGDHLGSTSVMVNADGSGPQTQGYYPFGETRFGGVATEYQYTGQFNQAALGLYYYGARWYDSYLNRWTSPDTVIPDYYNSLDWDRYSYVRNNPVRNTDSSGHCIDGLTTVPCLLALIAIAGGAGGAAIYQWNDIGHSWWESPEYAAGTAQAAVEGALAAEGAGLLVGSAAAAAAPVIAAGLCADGDCGNEIGATGEIGQRYLSQAGGESQVRFPTTQGDRVVDQLVNGMAYESKVGYTTLTNDISTQVAKDVELLTTGMVDSVSWVFFPSPVTGKGGPSKALFDLLIQNGIQIFYVDPSY